MKKLSTLKKTDTIKHGLELLKGQFGGVVFILENEEDLETIFTSERLVKNCDSKKYQNLKSGLDKYYDGKNIERIRQTITKLAES